MNKLLVLAVIINLVGCSGIGKKDPNIDIIEVGKDFKTKPIKLIFYGKYINKKGILKSKAKIERKKQLMQAVENSLHAVFNTGAAYPIYTNIREPSYVTNDGSRMDTQGAFGSKDIYKALSQSQFVPAEIVAFSEILGPNTFQLTKMDKNDIFLCTGFHRECKGQPATFVYNVDDKGNRIIVGGLGSSKDKITLPAYKINKANRKYVYAGKMKNIVKKEKIFFRKHAFINISKLYQNILDHKFTNCRRGHVNEILDIETCLSKNMPPTDYISNPVPSQNKLLEKLASERDLRFSYWGVLYLINTTVEIKRVNKEKFKIELTINTPHLYKNIKKVSDYLE
jgi:hypothetical protein